MPVLPALKNATETAVPTASVSKRNTPSAPQLHSVSFGDFGDVLSSALWHGSADNSSNHPISQAVEPETSARTINSSKQFAKLKTDTPLTNPDGSEKPRRPDTDDAKRVNEVTNKTASSKPASPDLPLGRAIVSVKAGGTPTQASAPTEIEAVEYVLDTANAERAPAPAGSSNGSANSPQVERIGAGLQVMPGQGQHADVDHVPTLQDEAEVFRLDLHPDASLIQSSDLTSSSNSDVKGRNQASGAQTTVAAPTSTQAQESRLSLSGTPPEASNQPKQNPTVSQSENVANPGPGPQATSSSKKQSAGDSSEPNKPGEKGAGDSGAEILNHAGTPSAAIFSGAIFSAPVRTDARMQQVGPAASVEVSKITDAPAIAQTKEMVVRVEGESGAVVSVRLVDLGEQVQVAVRSADPFAAAQLRQDLTSLASNLDRIGWRTDAVVSAAPQNLTLSEPSRPDGESDTGNTGSKPDWDDAPGHRRNTPPELWDMFLASQDA
jgi:hypothetical protein